MNNLYTQRASQLQNVYTQEAALNNDYNTQLSQINQQLAANDTARASAIASLNAQFYQKAQDVQAAKIAAEEAARQFDLNYQNQLANTALAQKNLDLNAQTTAYNINKPYYSPSATNLTDLKALLNQAKI